MKQERREYVLGLEHVVAAYWYTTFSKSLPLLILPGNELPKFSRVPKDIPGWIVLTEQDIQFGKDVFAVNYLHFQHRSHHLHGSDILKDMIIVPADIRRELEGILREVLIDIREHMLLGRTPDKSVIRSFQNILDRIRLATSILLGGTPFVLGELGQAVESLDTKVEGKQMLLYEMIFVDELCDVQLLHDHLTALVASVDGLPVGSGV